MESLWGFGLLLTTEYEGSNSGVRTNYGTLVALNTLVNLPLRDHDSNPSFFISCCTHGEGAIFHSHESTDGKIVSFIPGHGTLNVRDKIRFVKRRDSL